MALFSHVTLRLGASANPQGYDEGDQRQALVRYDK